MKKIGIIVRIRLNETGEVREYKTEAFLNDGESVPSTYIWEEGNYSCDCNRSLFFEYALHPDRAMDSIESPCGDGKFSVEVLIAETGEVYYSEFEEGGAA